MTAGQDALLQYTTPARSAGTYEASPLFAEVLAAEMDSQMMRLAASGEDEQESPALFSTDISDLAVSSMMRQESSHVYEEASAAENDIETAVDQIMAAEPEIEIEFDGGMYISKAYAGPSLQGEMYPASAYSVYPEEAYTEYTAPAAEAEPVSSDGPYTRSPEELRAARELAADYAVSRKGDPYSQSLRGQGSYVDCSSLTQWAYRQAGFSIPATAAEQARYCSEHDYLIPTSELQKGDLVFWRRSGCGCGRYNEIHHVAVYIGDGQIVEASSSRGRVVQNSLWGVQQQGSWKVAMCARPT